MPDMLRPRRLRSSQDIAKRTTTTTLPTPWKRGAPALAADPPVRRTRRTASGLGDPVGADRAAARRWATNIGAVTGPPPGRVRGSPGLWEATWWTAKPDQGPPVARLVGLGIALAVVLAAVIAWVLAAHLRPTAWDTSLHAAGLDHRTAGLTAVAVAVSASSEYLAYVVAAVGTLLALRPRPWWFGALAGVLLLAAGQGIRVALAAVIGRSRPPEADWGMHAAGFSMPSGHTATATFAAGLLCLGLARALRGAWRFAARGCARPVGGPRRRRPRLPGRALAHRRRRRMAVGRAAHGSRCRVVRAVTPAGARGRPRGRPPVAEPMESGEPVSSEVATTAPAKGLPALGRPSLPRMRQLLRFAWIEAQCCLFAVLFYVGLALVRIVPLPVDPADALLIWCLGVTFVLWLVGWETGREVGVIFGFHLVGLALELFKVRQGSWSYPDTGLASIGGVPALQRLHVRRRRQLRLPGLAPVRPAHHRLPGPRATAAVAVLVYLNFFTSHVIWDLRLPLALALLLATWRTWVHFTVGPRRYAMPLALSFVLIGFFLWVAENAATLGRAWQYPSQESVWTLVHPAKVGSWSLLVVVSIVLVAAVKAYEGRLYGTARDLTVLRAGRRPWRPAGPIVAGGPVPAAADESMATP